MTFDLQDIDKLSLVKRIQDWEKKGFECICPITAFTSCKKEWHYKGNNFKKNAYRGTAERVIYKARMRKVKR